MPCMYNGQPVKGVKGACPMNSTWVEDTPQEPADDRNILQKGLGWVAENPLEAASYGLMFGGPLGWAGRGALTGYKALRAGGAMKGRAGKLMDRLFRKEGTPANPGFTMPQGVNQMARNTGKKGGVNMRTSNATPLTGGASEATRVFKRPSKLAIGGTAGAIGGAGMLNYANKDERMAYQQKLMEKQQLDKNIAMDANTKALAKINADKAEKDRREGLGEWGRMQEDMKKPEFWSKNMGGGPNDTRMMRMAQLMSWMGKTPNQKAQSTDPQKLWASAEKGVMDNIAALEKAQATLKSKYGKPTTKDLAAGMFDMVKEAYGDTLPWIPGGQKDDDELERISSLSAVRFIELSQDPSYMNLGEEQLRAEAVKQVGEELGIA